MKPKTSTMKNLNHWKKKLKKTLDGRKTSHSHGSKLIMWKWIAYKNRSVNPILFNILGLCFTNIEKTVSKLTWKHKAKCRANNPEQNECCGSYHQTLFPTLKSHGDKYGMILTQKHTLGSYRVLRYLQVPKFW